MSFLPEEKPQSKAHGDRVCDPYPGSSGPTGSLPEPLSSLPTLGSPWLRPSMHVLPRPPLPHTGQASSSQERGPAPPPPRTSSPEAAHTPARTWPKHPSSERPPLHILPESWHPITRVRGRGGHHAESGYPGIFALFYLSRCWIFFHHKSFLNDN